MNKKIIQWWADGGSSTLVSENFDRTSSDISGAYPIPVGISNWVKLYGNTGIIKTTPGQGQNTTNSALYSTNAGQRNVDISIKCNVITSSLYLQLAESDINNRVFVRCSNGAVTQVLAGSSTTPFVGSGSTANNDTMRCVLIGPTMSIYRNTTLLGTATISESLMGTNVGIIVFPLDTTVRFDDFLVVRP